MLYVYNVKYLYSLSQDRYLAEIFQPKSWKEILQDVRSDDKEAKWSGSSAHETFHWMHHE
jgi:hypothetical protein